MCSNITNILVDSKPLTLFFTLDIYKGLPGNIRISYLPFHCEIVSYWKCCFSSLLDVIEVIENRNEPANTDLSASLELMHLYISLKHLKLPVVVHLLEV